MTRIDAIEYSIKRSNLFIQKLRTIGGEEQRSGLRTVLDKETEKKRKEEAKDTLNRKVEGNAKNEQ